MSSRTITARSSRSRLLSDASTSSLSSSSLLAETPVPPIGLGPLAETRLSSESSSDNDSDSNDAGYNTSNRDGNANTERHRRRRDHRNTATAATTDTEHDNDYAIQDDAESDLLDDSTSKNSIYPEVRAAVLPIDNVHLSIDTPRMWILSLLFAILGSSTNLFFSLRYPSVAITPVIALILVHPIGRAWDLFLKRAGDPEELFHNGVRSSYEFQNPSDDTSRSLGDRARLWLAQGHWNEKEHACVYISSNVSFGFAFATDVIVEQHKFYKQDAPIPYQLLLTVSSQILGYAFAGLARRYLVRPPSMIWPGILASAAMFTTLHKKDSKASRRKHMTRLKFFILVWAAGFAWYFLPGLLMPALGAFNVVTWFDPNNVVLANLFGVRSGLGMFPVTFDWAYIAYIGSPLLTPWWAAANVLAGVVAVMWVVAPILYYANVLFAAYMPMLSSSVFDNTGKIYDVSRILTPNFRFDLDGYKNYSAIYLPITYVLSYALQFAGLAALVSHTVCWYGSDIIRQTKESLGRTYKTSETYQSVPSNDTPTATPRRRSSHTTSSTLLGQERRPLATYDIHNRLMAKYQDAPFAWYIACLISMLILAIITVEAYPTLLPWYGVIFALTITLTLFLPAAIIMAITNQHISLYLLSQIICGIVFPGRPVANMIFVTYCYISSAQGIKFASDLKLGHYMKLPPKLLFKVQVVATLISSLTQVGVLNWMFANIGDLCAFDAANGFSCPIARVHFNGSILWGVVGPGRFFGSGALYKHLIWAFPLGFLAPLVVWYVSRRRHASNLWSLINFPILFGTLSWMPPATGLNFSVWAMVCFVFNYLVRRRAFGWWSRYTMSLSAALDFGLACGLVLIFFVFLYPGWMDGFRWWGTEVHKQGCDWKECSFLTLGPGERFDT